ncbi:MAG TPA: SDR family oxidoreductase [Puia sp.]|jgi:NADP-dependent 3-hydroxy acid dehydrogenase YdfG|nr:SDR family oxidoreductase [Puia sp.]
MEKFFKNKVILISGEVSSLSIGIIHSFLKEMAIVIFPAKSLHQVDMVKSFDDINQYENLITLLIDVQDFDKVIETCETITDRFGKIDIAIEIPEFSKCKKALTEASIDEWNHMMETDMVPFFMGARIVLNLMKDNLSGMFVHISDSRLLENLKSNALTRVAITTKMEMSKIFAEEAQHHGIRYYHLLLQDLSAEKTPDLNHVSSEMSAGLISQAIKDLYRKENYNTEMALQSFPKQFLHQQI